MGVFAGLGFGSMLLTREDSIVLFVPIFLAYLLYFVRDGVKAITRDRVFLLTFLGFTIVMGGLMLGPYNRYVAGTFSSVVTLVPGGWTTVFLGAGVLIVVALVLRWKNSVYKYLVRHRKLVLGAVCLVVFAAFVYMLFIKPALLPAGTAEAPVKALTLKYFAYYITLLGIFLAVAGYVMFIYSGLDRQNLMLPLTGLTFTGLFVYQPMVTLVLVWWMRRLAPVALPVAVLMMAYALYWVWDKVRGRWVYSRMKMGVARAGLALVAVVLVALCVSSSAKLAWMKGSRATLPFVKTVSQLTPEPALIVGEAFTGNILGAPLRSFYGRGVVTVWDPKNYNNPLFLDFLRQSQAKGQQNYIIWAKDSVPLLLPGAERSLHMEHVAEVVGPLNAVPQTKAPTHDVVDWSVVLEIFKVTPKAAPATTK